MCGMFWYISEIVLKHPHEQQNYYTFLKFFQCFYSHIKWHDTIASPVSADSLPCPSAISLCHVLSYVFWFSVSFRCGFICVLFLWIMLHLISHIIVFYVETALSLHFGFGLLVHCETWQCLCILIIIWIY